MSVRLTYKKKSGHDERKWRVNREEKKKRKATCEEKKINY
jgi:hypothetical protein